MTLFQTVTILIVLTALGGYLNHRLLHLPPTIGLMAIALVSSLTLVALGETGVVEVHKYARFVPSIDFGDLVFHGFLAFLLFAGALHVDLADLYKVKWTVTILSTLGTIISTFVIGALFWCAAHSFGYDLRFIYALLFGALISPTDPIAVLGIIKKAGAPKDQETRITGESLFNDGCRCCNLSDHPGYCYWPECTEYCERVVVFCPGSAWRYRTRLVSRLGCVSAVSQD